ncbi:T9SS C-terminal target domain-containing protein [Paenimyroides tangerinum]|uniref:T9SS C-terminal target domain-containing protein n=1 Tax=Paenimyroides tangerinum TaxID=2488728 RepID=A0A3P3WD42_9FLAO|nr:S8/S53 family peptidase [Paenimyroides tangerinum]RRJ93081.1 T9SS C-terminal target domain-containing protein [Paenimyroides tangerinum]
MKCKLSKLFFLALIGAISMKGYSQTDEERINIAKGYDLKKLEQMAVKFRANQEESYAKGLVLAKERGLPIDGVTPEGAFFSLKGVDSETGELVYFQTYNNSTTESSVQTARAQHLYNGGSLGIDIQGQNMNLGIWDGGQPQANHPNLGVSRTLNKDNQLNVPGSVEFQQEGRDHATHVGGTMIGNGPVVAARGIAFDGRLWSNTWQYDHTEMAEQAAQGLLVSNHSYGIGNTSYMNQVGIYGRYNSEANAVDDILFDAEKYQAVYAAGNDRTQISGAPSNSPLNPTKLGFDQMVNETASKNAVVVGAINGFTNYTSPTAVVMTSFSQWGPTDDFRVKPDIVAKGFGVYSSNFPTAGSSGSYDSYPGTSMAAPSVTAVFALWQQYSRVLWPFGLSGLDFADRYFRSATIRALMAHTASNARYSTDTYTVGGPNARFGWGVINAEGGAKVMKAAKDGNAVLKELTLVSGQVYELHVVLDGSEALTATMAWTDKPGNIVSATDSTTPVLVNDLDLRIIRPSGGDPLMPWSLSKTSMINPAPVRDVDNNVDNIEKIDYTVPLFDGAPAGVYKVFVTHKGNALDSGSQKFSLIVSGGVVDFYEPNVSSDDFKIESLNVYPNPVTDILNVSADFSVIENAAVSLFDMLGKKVYSDDSLFAFSGDATINVSGLNSGVYLLQISKNGKIDTRKIVIK